MEYLLQKKIDRHDVGGSSYGATIDQYQLPNLIKVFELPNGDGLATLGRVGF